MEEYLISKLKKEAKGKSLSEARKRAEQIKYSYQIENQLILDNYFITDLKINFAIRNKLHYTCLKEHY
jgi:hypothetical protein